MLGRARRSLGEIELAEADLNGALDAAAEACDDELGADARIGLAGVLSFAGRSAAAFVHLDEAARLGSARLRAYAALQRAIIEQRLGRMAEAAQGYESALPTLRQIDARVDIALVLMNRGVIRIHSGECDAAIADLSESGRLFDAEGHDFGVAQARHGLGWAYARSGDIPRALHHLDEATERFQLLGHDAMEVDVERIEVLLAAGLFGEAGERAAATAAQLLSAGNHSVAGEVWLLYSRAALLDGDRPAAAAYAERAWLLFAGQDAIGWEHAAHLEVLRCGDGRVDELITVADRLQDCGNARGAATALALAAVQACRAGNLERADELAAECARRAARLGLFEVRMLAANARATCAAARGDLGSARRQVRSALDDLDRHRTSLAATDARASVSVHATELAALGLRLALSGGSAASVLEWIERSRAGRGRDLPPRPPEDSALAGDLTELRSVVATLRAAEAQGSDTASLLARQRDLERSIHQRQLRQQAGRDGTRVPVPSLTRLRQALADAALVELAEIDGRLVAVTVGEGRARVVDLGAAADLYGVVSVLMAALRASVVPSRSRAGSADLLQQSLVALDHMVRSAMPAEGPVLLVLPPALHVLPWHLLPGLSGRGVTVAPSAAWWLRVQSTVLPPAGGGAALVAGPRLAEAEHEVRDIAGSYPGAVVLTGPAATTAAVVTALAGAPVAHIACHGRVRHDNALWSALEFHDGPLYVYDLERSPRTPPFVVLSGCETGVGIRAGDQLLGLSATFLGHGTRSLVAAICPLPDSAATREVMTALHQQVVAGAAPSQALARLSSGALSDEHVLIAACLSCFGAC